MNDLDDTSDIGTRLDDDSPEGLGEGDEGVHLVHVTEDPSLPMGTPVMSNSPGNKQKSGILRSFFCLQNFYLFYFTELEIWTPTLILCHIEACMNIQLMQIFGSL